MNRVTYFYKGATGGYHIELDGEQVHFTKDEYQRDMFMAELKARIKLLEPKQDVVRDALWEATEVIRCQHIILKRGIDDLFAKRPFDTNDLRQVEYRLEILYKELKQITEKSPGH